MKKHLILPYLAALSIFIVGTLFAQTIYREVKRSNEKEVRVRLQSTFGSVNLSKGDNADNIVEVYFKRKKKNSEPNLELDYFLQKGVGELHIEMNPDGMQVHTSHDDKSINIKAKNFSFNVDEWYVMLTGAIPVYLEAELGAGKSDFDFSGLHINELSISTGASSSTIAFHEPNKGEIDELQIETGVSKFRAENLNNANYRKLTFDGGVGSYYLDFGGKLQRTVDVEVNVGLGAITLVIPKSIGVKVRYEDSWLSNFTIDDEFVRKRKNVYESENWEHAEGRMNVFIESGLGSVKIKRTK